MQRKPEDGRFKQVGLSFLNEQQVPSNWVSQNQYKNAIREKKGCSKEAVFL